MGKRVTTAAGLTGLGSLLAGVGAPKVIEGLPDWVNLTLFGAGVVLILAAFASHLLSQDDANGVGITQTSSGQGSPNLYAGDGSTINLHFDIRSDSQMPDKDEDTIRRLLERNGSNGHTVTSHHQSGGITAGEVHVHAEDKSLKRQLRNLLAAADSRIPFEIDGGNLDIETRMTSAQFARLSEIVATPGSANLIASADVTGRFGFTGINNGTFGPTTNEVEQIRVKFQFTDELKE